ncbi:MAG: putative membrane protein, partial [Saprospiraceae bacterium]
MKTSHWFLILLTAFTTVLFMILISDPPIASTGKLHDQFKTMMHSGSSVIASAYVKWLAFLFGLGIIAIFGMAVSFGAKKYGQLKGIKSWLYLGIIAFLLVFTMITFIYWEYSATGSRTIFGGLPLPTALMMYTLGTVPLIFTLIYVVKFRSWVLTEEEEKRFQEIIEKR